MGTGINFNEPTAGSPGVTDYEQMLKDAEKYTQGEYVGGRATVSFTISLGNYESMKVSIEGSSINECIRMIYEELQHNNSPKVQLFLQRAVFDHCKGE